MSRGKKNRSRQQGTGSAAKNDRAINTPERQALVQMQVRGFAAAGWVAGATDTNNGIKWRWYREGSSYVIAGRALTGSKVCDDVGDAEIVERFSPADVLRIRAAR
jgi:hypothetical protein